MFWVIFGFYFLFLQNIAGFNPALEGLTIVSELKSRLVSAVLTHCSQ